MISIILTTRNTLPYTKLAYASLRRYNPTIEIVILDDVSTDGTIEWMDTLHDVNLIKWKNDTGKQLGHTITYNIGANIATQPIICIFHSDMVCSPNFIQNLTKHLKPKTIVSGTRIEPPVYPSDKAKITENFGIYINEFKESEFLNFVEKKESEFANKITKGFFAPWIMFREEYISMGGMDELFKPYPTEDSDFINRVFLAKYDIIQSRDSFCYHWASRSHRWTTGKVNVDPPEFIRHQYRSFKNFFRKWGSNPQNDEFSYPIINKKYDIGFIIHFDKNMDENFILGNLPIVESLSSTLYTNLSSDFIKKYISIEGKETKFNLYNKMKSIGSEKVNDVLVEFNFSDFVGKEWESYYKSNDNSLIHKQHLWLLTMIQNIIADSGDIGEMEYDIFKINIKSLNTYENRLIDLNDSYYKQQLIAS